MGTRMVAIIKYRHHISSFILEWDNGHNCWVDLWSGRFLSELTEDSIDVDIQEWVI